MFQMPQPFIASYKVWCIYYFIWLSLGNLRFDIGGTVQPVFPMPYDLIHCFGVLVWELALLASFSKF